MQMTNLSAKENALRLDLFLVRQCNVAVIDISGSEVNLECTS